MKYTMNISDQEKMEVTKLNPRTIQINKTDLQNGINESIVLTKEQIYTIERFLKMGVMPS